MNQKVKYLTSRYKGKGRPRNSDYILVKRKDIPDYRAMEILQNGFSTSYIGDGEPLINHP